MQAAVLLSLLGCLAGAHMALAAPKTGCDAFGPRVQCGTLATTQTSCEAMGCCWASQPLPVLEWQPDVYLYSCFFANAGASEYSLKGNRSNGTLSNLTTTQPELGADIQSLSLVMQEITPDTLRVRITDANSSNPRWEVPAEFYAPGSLLNNGSSNTSSSGGPQYKVVVKNSPFGFAVVRSNSGATTFNTSGLRLIFKDQYIELSTWVAPNAFIYGGGERSSVTTYMTRNGYPYTNWNRDQNPQTTMRNTYGHWPFAMVLEADGTAWAAMLHTSNGLDMVATEDRLSWRVIGGIIDLYVFIGPTPLDVISQLTALVGRPTLPPFWSLGFHQCKYGYKSVYEVEQVVANYSAANIPLETIWVDIDHMDAYRVFSFDPVNFPLAEMQNFVSKLHGAGQHWVPILDPGIKIDSAFGPYLQGLEQNAFLKGVDGGDYIGQVWPGAVHFPDFGFNPAADAYWQQQLDMYNNKSQWDGLWIDMNELANFCTGDICSLPTPSAVQNQIGFQQWQCQLLCYASTESGLSVAQQSLTMPPYTINNALQYDPLDTKAASVLAQHEGGVLEYDAHNLYGLLEARATKAAIQAVKGKRPFIVSRSTALGSGGYTFHWTGDNNSSWTDLQWSIPGLINSGLSGIPMVGADICGFAGNTTEELCSRWIELGALYPFSRDHADKSANYQELYRWASVADTGRRVLAMRYRLLPFLYTVLQNSTETGAPLFRALFMNYPQDPVTFPISTQFMLGDALLVTPVLAPNTSSVVGYFPTGMWYNLWDNSTVDTRGGGNNATLAAPIGSIPLHICGGSALAMQQPGMTTAEVQQSPITIVAALPQPVPAAGASASNGTAANSSAGTGSMTAAGYMFHDDGESIQVNTSCCNFLSFKLTVGGQQAQNGSRSGLLEIQFGRPGQDASACDGGNASLPWPPLRGIQVLGWQAGARNAVVQMISADGASVTGSQRLKPAQVVTDGHQLLLNLDGSEVEMGCPDRLRVRWQAA